MKHVALVFVLACSSSQRADPEPTREVETAPEAAPVEHTVEHTAERGAQFVTVAEIWAPDESAVLGVVLAMREEPRGTAHDFEMPTGDHDPGDGFAVLFGARLIREDGAIISATTEETTRSFELRRTTLPGPVQVWTFDGDAGLSAVHRIEPCQSCEPWRSPPTRYLMVVPEGQSLRATPEPGWTIAISP